MAGDMVVESRNGPNDPQGTLDRLYSLPPASRAAFAMCCAERLFTGYQRYVDATGDGNAILVREALDQAWSDLTTLGDVDVNSARLIALSAECEALAPDIIDFPTEQRENAVGVIGAVCNALLAVAGVDDVVHAMAPANRANEAIEALLESRYGLSYIDPHQRERIDAHPLVIAERTRQGRDLDELRTWKETWSEKVARLRARARSEQIYE
jgi:uncharacterized protein YjaG (DUF416 family)